MSNYNDQEGGIGEKADMNNRGGGSASREAGEADGDKYPQTAAIKEYVEPFRDLAADYLKNFSDKAGADKLDGWKNKLQDKGVSAFSEEEKGQIFGHGVEARKKTSRNFLQKIIAYMQDNKNEELRGRVQEVSKYGKSLLCHCLAGSSLEEGDFSLFLDPLRLPADDLTKSELAQKIGEARSKKEIINR